jgi:hypothetical protein
MMKVKIEYEFDPTYNAELAYWAKCGSLARCGASFAAAEARLIEDLRTLPAAPVAIPAPKEIEIQPAKEQA